MHHILWNLLHSSSCHSQALCCMWLKQKQQCSLLSALIWTLHSLWEKDVGGDRSKLWCEKMFPGHRHTHSAAQPQTNTHTEMHRQNPQAAKLLLQNAQLTALTSPQRVHVCSAAHVHTHTQSQVYWCQPAVHCLCRGLESLVIPIPTWKRQYFLPQSQKKTQL